FALRPERVRLGPPGAPAENEAAGTLRESAYRGGTWLALAALPGGGELRATLAAPPPPPGSAVTLAWDAADLVPLAD
ncbi:MAG TPA: TOBE domain-containing protein, partial [Crenalkalicoccus sp.]|nr:TOBE domain-containing protein [Crenalkalicoccus sp.]